VKKVTGPPFQLLFFKADAASPVPSSSQIARLYLCGEIPDRNRNDDAEGVLARTLKILGE
jgi:hypothetical protein